jgi:hypothetical protein
MMPTLDAEALLRCWEAGRNRHPLDRGLLLFALARPEQDPDTLADEPLGARNAALLRLRRSMFGETLRSRVACPECAENLEFELEVARLQGADAGTTIREVSAGARRLRAPTTRDLSAIANVIDPAVACHALLERLHDSVDDLQVEDAAALLAALDVADPCLDVAVAVVCPACEHAWSAAFDPADFLWTEMEVHVRRLLDEVHLVASHYGWDEQRILHMSPARRGAYVARLLS